MKRDTVLIVSGAVVAALGLLADVFGMGRDPGFGPIQIGVTALGADAQAFR